MAHGERNAVEWTRILSESSEAFNELDLIQYECTALSILIRLRNRWWYSQHRRIATTFERTLRASFPFESPATTIEAFANDEITNIFIIFQTESQQPSRAGSHNLRAASRRPSTPIKNVARSNDAGAGPIRSPSRQNQQVQTL
jgi:hypothetical protein